MGFRDWRVRLGWLLGVGAVAFGGGYLQLVLNPRGGPAPFLYQPVGLGLALILLFGPRVAPGLALGALAAPLAAGAPAAEAAGNALAVMAEALSGYSLLRRRGWALQPRLERPRDVFLLAFAVIAPASLAGVLVRSLARAATGPPLPPDPELLGMVSWLAALAGNLIAVPAVLAWAVEPMFGRATSTRLERAAWAATLLLLSYFLLGGWFNYRSAEGLTGLTLFAVLAGWTALRYEVRGAVLFNLIAGLVALWNVYLDRGPLAEALTSAERLNLLSMVNVLVLFLLLLASVVSEHRNALQERQFLVLELQARQAGLESVNAQLMATTQALRAQAEQIEEQGRREREQNAQLERLLSERQTHLLWLESILRQLPVGVLIAEAPSGRPVRGNDALGPIFGRPFDPDSYAPQPGTGIAPFCTAYHPDGRPFAPDDWPLARVLRGGEPVPEQEMILRRPDGSRRVVRMSAAPLRSAEGRLTAGILTLTDITDRRRLEEQLTQAGKMEAIGLLAGGIAHDFNNLLTAIRSALSLVRLPVDDPNRELLRSVERAARRGANLAGKLLGFARRRQLEFGPVDLGQVLDETVAILGRTIDPRIRIEVSHAPGLPPVLADAGELQSVAFNLCVNARDAMPQGGLLAIATSVVHVPGPAQHPPGEEGRDFVRLTVEDTGVGMDETMRAHLFEPFFTTKPFGEGTGLGLAMAYGIVQQHKGWIDCSSEPGRGTRFDVYLPLAEGEEAAATFPWAAEPLGDSQVIRLPDALPAAIPAAEAPTVLVVEDEDSVRLLAKLILEDEGYRVLAAADGVEAVELYQKAGRGQIDLVLLDRTMPRLSGLETFQRLRAINPGVRVLFCSGYSADLGESCEGAAGFLPKPYGRAELVAKVQEVLTAAPNGEPPPCAQ